MSVILHPKKKDFEKIATIQLEYLKDKLEAMGIQFKYPKTVIKKLCDTDFDEKYGARPLIRNITEIIEDKISDEIIENTNTKKIELKIENDEIKVRRS